jgi:hypothetical protein
MILKGSLMFVLLAGVSCGASSLGGSGGAGGSGGTGAGGSGGGAGTSAGGPAGGPAIEASLPPCLADLVAPCTCQWTGGACGAQTCFAASVTTSTSNPDGGACNDTGAWAETRVLKPDGSLCYSVRRSGRADHACEDGVISWWDASGQMVASADGFYHFAFCSPVTPTITCAATGETGIAPDPWPNFDCPANACP